MLGIPGPADIKRYATIAAQNAVPTEWQYVAEKVQDGMVKKSEKDKEVAKETGKTLKKIDVKKAKDTIVDIF